MKTRALNNRFDKVCVERIQLEDNSSNAMLSCTIFEGDESYSSDIFINHSSLNALLCELSVRGFDLDLDKQLVEMPISEDESVYFIDCSSAFDSPVVLPVYALPEQVVMLRA